MWIKLDVWPNSSFFPGPPFPPPPHHHHHPHHKEVHHYPLLRCLVTTAEEATHILNCIFWQKKTSVGDKSSICCKCLESTSFPSLLFIISKVQFCSTCKTSGRASIVRKWAISCSRTRFMRTKSYGYLLKFHIVPKAFFINFFSPSFPFSLTFFSSFRVAKYTHLLPRVLFNLCIPTQFTHTSLLSARLTWTNWPNLPTYMFIKD